jgi:hypothetical protein
MRNGTHCGSRVAFSLGLPQLNVGGKALAATSTTKCTRVCRACAGSGRTSRRAVLQVGIGSALSAFLGSVGVRAGTSDDEKNVTSPGASDKAETKSPANTSVCKNCTGSGKVPCDLCSGTGFWRALARNDVNQKYQGVVCPECEGAGTLTCPVCLGTGEGDIRGLLRRRRIEPGPGRILQRNM